MSVEILFEQIVENYIAPSLKHAGFAAKPAGLFVRWEEDCLWRVGCCFTKMRGQDAGSFTIALCVGFPDLAKFLKNFPHCNVREVKQPCTMATSLEHLRPPHNWPEWALISTSDVKAVGDEVASVLKEYGLRFFENYGSLDKCVAAWESGINHNLGPSADFYLSSVYWLRGEKERAIEFVNAKITECIEMYNKQGNRSGLFLKRQREDFLKFLQAQ